MLTSKLLSSAPHIATQRALIVLDLQNDFVRQHGNLFVPNAADFLSLVPDLARLFRESGEVIWVQSVFEERRPVHDALGRDTVVLEDGSSSTSTSTSTSTSNSKPASRNANTKQPVTLPPDTAYQDDPEAFLSASDKVCAGRRCCLPNSSGFHFPAPILAAIDPNEDTVLVKSEYSAFQTHGLLLSLRSRFVTEVFVCGSLSNASVYATVLDAVRHGLAVTLIEDCLGYRSSLRHREAMRRMADIMGANGITSRELMDGQDDFAPSVSSVHAQPTSSLVTGIEERIGTLGLSSSPTQKNADSQSPAWRHNVPVTRRRKQADKPKQDGADQTKDFLQTGQRPVAQPEKKVVDNPQAGQPSPRKQKPAQPLNCGPGDSIASGDSRILYDLDIPAGSFQRLREEVNWQKMYHMSGQVPRLVSVQGSVAANGSIPIYRHPADESPPLSPFTATVDQIRAVVEKLLGHPLNHVLIQLYRDGDDRISEHSDKTLDIVRGSNICNVSLGAQRAMTLRTKADAKGTVDGANESGRQTQRVPMPHNSLFILGEKSNMEWLHGIRPDKRPDKEKSPEELAFNGQRISLTFRQIGTFINPKTDTIWGQGALSKTEADARTIVHGESTQTERMIRAFGKENQQSDFNWEEHYGLGFDVVNFVTTSTAKLITAGCDATADLSVRLALTENGIRYDMARIDDLPSKLISDSNVRQAREKHLPLLVDSDGSTIVTGNVDILLHIAHIAHNRLPEVAPDPETKVDGLTLEDRLDAADTLHRAWTTASSGSISEQANDTLSLFGSLILGKFYINGKLFGVDDCAVWPILKDIVETKDGNDVLEDKFPVLTGYYARVKKRACVKQVMDETVALAG
ncbi:isochorismatase family protein [Arthroderma uncinatum]|uniref:isochorismatase family protein n=1 Tax=Arthroderma uncinatum TaxID=74035 RepID=UPI00144A66EA|nr:isochorismatase family protein [Arthroderma uncinatum]KAF3482643.1 isochorismatase family protein [Arthroderma uncinatum]